MKFEPKAMIGTWYAELSSDTSKNSIFRILDDYRYISFAEDDRPEAKCQWMPIRLWGSFDEDGAYRLRPRKDHAGWTRLISFDGDIMTIKATEPETRAWRCEKIEQADIPEWFDTEAALAIERLWK